MSVVLPNSIADAEAPDVPMRPDGTPYRFEMLFNGFAERAYADTAEELLAFLIRGYDRMPKGQRLAARLHFAARSQVTVQSYINADSDLSGVSPEEWVILNSTRATPPEVGEWAAEVPLVLIDVFYQPLGNLPRPTSAIADVEEPPNIFWLAPTDEYEFLISLHRVGVIALHEAIPAAA